MLTHYLNVILAKKWNRYLCVANAYVMRTRCKRVRVIRAETRARAEFLCVANAYVMHTRCKRVRVIRCKGVEL